MITTPATLKQLEGLTEYLKSVPYDVTRKSLYSADELYAGFDRNDPQSFETCFDTRVYRHFIDGGKRAELAVE